MHILTINNSLPRSLSGATSCSFSVTRCGVSILFLSLPRAPWRQDSQPCDNPCFPILIKSCGVRDVFREVIVHVQARLSHMKKLLIYGLARSFSIRRTGAVVLKLIDVSLASTASRPVGWTRQPNDRRATWRRLLQHEFCSVLLAGMGGKTLHSEHGEQRLFMLCWLWRVVAGRSHGYVTAPANRLRVEKWCYPIAPKMASSCSRAKVWGSCGM